MKNAVFGDVKPCGCCKNRRFGGTHCLHHQGDKNQRVNWQLKPIVLRCVLRLLDTANVSSSPILVTLMIRRSDPSDFTRATRRNIPEDGILLLSSNIFPCSFCCHGII
jgi:hypothetical protein